MKLFNSFLPLVIVFFFAPLSRAQVRIVQWSDAHSSLSTLPQQLLAIDQFAKDFYSQYPKGEFIVYVLGDFTSLSPYSQRDGGQLSFEALKLLKDRGYTVLFTPGNHDAFDWSGKVNGVELFLDQMRQLHNWGIPILVSNLKKIKQPLKSYVSDFYDLNTLDLKTAISGLTIDVLYQKSNLNEISASPLFEGVDKYERSITRLLAQASTKALDQLIIGLHQGHKRLNKLARTFSSKSKNGPQIPLMMAADDHLVAAYKSQQTLVSDAGSHGSMSIIDIQKDGQIRTPIVHVAIAEERWMPIKESHFSEGLFRLNTFAPRDIDADLVEFSHKVDSFIDKANISLAKTLLITRGIPAHKMHLKLGRTELGNQLSQSLIEWMKSLPFNFGESPLFAMVNSSSYRVEAPIPAGPVSEYVFREMYPFLNEAAAFRLTGQQIELLFFSFRKHYAANEAQRYSPQLSQNLRERGGRLEFFANNRWSPLQPKHIYVVAFDGWLAEHRFGQGSRVKEWIKILQKTPALATKSFQDVLVEYLPQVLRDAESTDPVRHKPRNLRSTHFLGVVSCNNLFLIK